MVLDPNIKDKDAVLRIVEIVILAPLTIAFVTGTFRTLLRWDATDIGYWFLIAHWWGLASLWWLVLRVRPDASALVRVPLVISLGLSTGSVCLIAMLYDASESPRPPMLFAYVVWSLPLVIAGHRLYRLYTYRRLITAKEPQGAV